MKTLLSNFAAIWNLILLLAVIGILFWFFYWFGLRRIIRAKRIASSRDRRMLREAAEREVNREV
jgi:predicted permease